MLELRIYQNSMALLFKFYHHLIQELQFPRGFQQLPGIIIIVSQIKCKRSTLKKENHNDITVHSIVQGNIYISKRTDFATEELGAQDKAIHGH